VIEKCSAKAALRKKTWGERKIFSGTRPWRREKNGSDISEKTNINHGKHRRRGNEKGGNVGVEGKNGKTRARKTGQVPKWTVPCGGKKKRGGRCLVLNLRKHMSWETAKSAQDKTKRITAPCRSEKTSGRKAKTGSEH